MRYTLTLPMPPSANRYWRVFRGHAVTSPEAKRYKREVALLAHAAGVRPLAGAVVLTMDVYRARRAGDLDNKIKVAIDSLQGVGYENDSQIIEIHARRFDDRDNPRVVVTLETQGEDDATS